MIEFPSPDLSVIDFRDSCYSYSTSVAAPATQTLTLKKKTFILHTKARSNAANVGKAMGKGPSAQFFYRTPPLF